MLFDAGRGNVEEFGQRARTSLMQGCTQPHLDCLQLDGWLFPLRHQDDREERLNFFRDFPMDRKKFFFSASVQSEEAS